MTLDTPSVLTLAAHQSPGQPVTGADSLTHWGATPEAQAQALKVMVGLGMPLPVPLERAHGIRLVSDARDPFRRSHHKIVYFVMIECCTGSNEAFTDPVAALDWFFRVPLGDFDGGCRYCFVFDCTRCGWQDAEDKAGVPRCSNHHPTDVARIAGRPRH